MFDWWSNQWLLTWLLVAGLYWYLFHRKEGFQGVPRHGNGYLTTPLNVLWKYYWPTGQVDGLPYRFGGMTKYQTYPYRSVRYYPGWYYQGVGYLG